MKKMSEKRKEETENPPKKTQRAEKTEKQLNPLEKILRDKGYSFFWRGLKDRTSLVHDFQPVTRNPEFTSIGTVVGFEFFGNQGSIQLQEVYYHIRQSLKSLRKFHD